MKQLRSVLPVVWVLVLLLAGGCDSSEPAGVVSAEQQISERVEARWGALSGGDFRAAYAFETPAYRDVVPYERFLSRYGSAVQWRGAKVKSITLGDAGETAKVNVAVEYTSHMAEAGAYPVTTPVYEDWILVAGEWWLVRK